MSAIITKENLRRKNFTPDEFLHSNTATKLGIKNAPDLNQLTAGVCLADKMQELRDAIGKPFSITSAFRSRELNAAVKGSPNSWHLQFLACDFNIKGMTPVEAVMAIKQSGVSVDKCFVERGCVHMQTAMNSSENRNEFGSAKLVDGKWVVEDQIKAVK